MLKHMMSRVVFAGVVICVVVAAVTAAPPAALMNPGKWEITMHTTEPVDVPPMTSVVCITTDAIARIAPPVSKPSHDCQLTTAPAFRNGVLTYTLACPKLGRTTTTTTTYSGDSYAASIVIEHADGAVTKQTITGKRLGNCDPQE